MSNFDRNSSQEDRLLYIVGPARSGTTFVLAQINLSDDAFLFSELNSFEFETGSSPAPDFCMFAQDFNRRKLVEGNHYQKGSWISSSPSLASPRQLYTQLQKEYSVVGEKIALGGRWSDGRYPADVLLEVQVNNHLHARHLLLLRSPTRTLASQREMFPRIPVKVLFESLLRSFLCIIEFHWRLPRARLLLYERIGSDVFSDVFEWLGLDWAKTRHLPFAPSPKKDWSFLEAMLTADVPQLASLEGVYDSLLESQMALSSSSWQPTRDFLSSREFEGLRSRLECLLQELHDEERGISSPSRPRSSGTTEGRAVLVLETDFPCETELREHFQALRRFVGSPENTFSDFLHRLSAVYPDTYPRLLELGCGNASFLKAAQELSFQIFGLDVDRATTDTVDRVEASPDLFFCDYTRPFTLREIRPRGKRVAKFHIITCWNILEHVPERRLNELLTTLRRHLDVRLGLFLASISLRPCPLAHGECHPPARPESWWRDVFRNCGFSLLDGTYDYLGPFPTRHRPMGDAGELCFIAATSRQNNEVTSRIDQLLEHRFAAAPSSWRELTQRLALVESSVQRLQILVGSPEDLNTLESGLRRLLSRCAGRDLFDLPNAFLVRAMLVAEHCRQHSITRVALFGAGRHTHAVLHAWNYFQGPHVEVVIVSHPQSRKFQGIPVVKAGDPLPGRVEAIIPSSHSFEKEMRAVTKKAYPWLPWIPFWDW